MDPVNVIELRNVTKEFPGVVAAKDVSFAIRQGEVHSIVGENGAGKSTLMNVIFGMFPPTRGEVWVGGERANYTSPLQAIAHGLGMVHQHFMLIQNFTVLQNIILGLEKSKVVVDYKAARAKVLEISERYGLKVDPDAYVSDISVPMQQRVEIVKVLWREADILIFDEPTAVLTPTEIDEFCQRVETFKQQGKTIVFISHKLAEVMRISDRITVMRRGEVIATKDVADTDEKDLAELMVGHSIQLGGGSRERIKADSPILEIGDLHYSDRGVAKLRGIDLIVNPGEIVGIAGIDGNGQEELVNIISGKARADSGTLLFGGKDLASLSIKARKQGGLSVVYEDRQKDGLVMSFSLRENLILGYQTEPKFLKHRFFLNAGAIDENGRNLREKFDIRSASLDIYASTLSGGNQQKVILAREISSDPTMLMTVQPTRGLDMGAIEFVHNRLVEQRNLGRGILFFSLELDEILQISDRVAVIFEGKIIKVLENKNLDKVMVGNYMLGIIEKGGVEV